MSAPAPRFLVLQHLRSETPGLLGDRWRACGVTLDAVQLDAGEALPRATETYTALVVMGGPQDVWETDRYPWLAAEIAFVREWVVTHGRPYLGICLGHQLLAEAVGGRVGPSSTPEVGVVEVATLAAADDDRLMHGAPGTFACFQWHGAEVKALPVGATPLVTNDACAVQAFRWGTRAYGYQYHVEVMPETVRSWGAEPAYLASLEAALGKGALEQVYDQVARHSEPFRQSAYALADRFLDLSLSATRRVA